MAVAVAVWGAVDEVGKMRIPSAPCCQPAPHGSSKGSSAAAAAQLPCMQQQRPQALRTKQQRVPLLPLPPLLLPLPPTRTCHC